MAKKTKKSAEKTQALIASALCPGIEDARWQAHWLYADPPRRLHRRTLARTVGREQTSFFGATLFPDLAIVDSVGVASGYFF